MPQDDAGADTPSAETTPPGATAKVRRKRRAQPKKKQTPATPSVKVDPAQALAFVRSRIRETKDPISRAFFEREAADLAERIKKAEEQRVASLSFKTKDGKTAKVGDVVYLIEFGYRNGRQGLQRLETLTVNNISDRKRQYGAQDRYISATTATGARLEFRLDPYNLHLYVDRAPCIAKAIEKATTSRYQARELLGECERDLAAIEAWRDGRTPSSAPPKETRRRSRVAKAPAQDELFNDDAEERLSDESEEVA